MSLSKFVTSDSSSDIEDQEWLFKRRRTKRHLKFHTCYSDSSSDDSSVAAKRLQVIVTRACITIAFVILPFLSRVDKEAF